jgi:hypothetical protein
MNMCRKLGCIIIDEYLVKIAGSVKYNTSKADASIARCIAIFVVKYTSDVRQIQTTTYHLQDKQ